MLPKLSSNSLGSKLALGIIIVLKVECSVLVMRDELSIESLGFYGGIGKGVTVLYRLF